MVHLMTARPAPRAPIFPGQYVSAGEAIHTKRVIPFRYVLVPDSLIVAFAHDPLAVGIYVAIARLALVAKGAVSVAARDLVVWMGSDRDADRAAIMRRIVKLAEDGWLSIERTAPAKHRLLPTWGRDQSDTVRAWRFDMADSGRPSHLRGRRLPIALFDIYLGRLYPRPGHGRALISRYFTRPLLDLIDIGVYTIGLRAEVTPTPRLRHLKLHSLAGMLPPPDSQSLLSLAAAGALTTLDEDRAVPVLLSIQGHAQLGNPVPSANQCDDTSTEYRCGSLHGSPDGSADGSRDLAREWSAFSHQDGQDTVVDKPPSLIAWDVGMNHESTNHDSAPDHGVAAGGGISARDGSVASRDLQAHLPVTSDRDWTWPVGDAPSQIAPALAAGVVDGHRALNVQRPILPGEWCELLSLQQAHGANQLLIWQARASRAAVERLHGITPSYYHACAAQAACDMYRPSVPWRAAASSPDDVPHAVASTVVDLDPAGDALLRALGVRERQKLASVPYDLIVSWQIALAHPGLAAQFTNPVGFAVAQMRRGNAPPPIAELDCWAERACRKNDRYESWRYVEGATIPEAAIAREQQLEARVRAIAPRDADLADLCDLARRLEAGATDAEAVAHLRTTRTGGWA